MASVAASTALIPVRAAPLVHVRKAETIPQGITVGELCEQFLESKSVKCKAGEMVQPVLKRYAMMCQRIKTMFGEMSVVENLKAMHFTRLHASLPSTWGPAVVGSFIQYTRTLFKFAYDSELIDRPMRFGPDFCKPSLRSYRKVRRLKGLQMFEAEEIRAMLNTLHDVLRRPSHPWSLRAMILLGVNCGFGNTDCGRLPFSALDLKGGWVNWPRPKTEADRRCPLWPETREAIERSLLERPHPKNPADADLVFLTKHGLPWSDGPSRALTKRLKWLMIRADVRRLFRSFYGLRRTFRTIADEASDSPATNLIMGHSAKSNDMGALYTQRIRDERLQKVVAHVREWLWPDNPLLWDDPNHEKAAASIAAEWNAIERLSHSDVVSAVKQLGITQRELARGTGLSEDWLSLVILGKEVMSASTELKIRYYVEDVSEGKTPMPKMKDQLWPQYRNPKDIPLTEGIVSALAVHPMTSEALTELTIWLASLGITQMKLSEWWCLNYNNVRDMRAGRRKISTRSANRLRELFGLPPVVIDYTPPKIPEFGAIPAPPEIQSLLERRKIGKQEVQAVIDYLQLNYGFESTKLSRRLGYGKQYVSSVVHGYISVNHIFAKRLRSLFAFAQTGGAE